MRPDSRLLLNVCKEVVSEEDFQERLDTTRERIDAIEVSPSCLWVSQQNSDTDDVGVPISNSHCTERVNSL